VKRPHKYGAKATVVDGIRFASQKEARRYGELKLLVRAGEITHLVLQPRFDLWAATPMLNGHHGIQCVGAYIGDFQYRDQRVGGYTVVEDVKGMKTPLYRLKKKLAEACHGITVVEI
jgi:uncharacterized protein DUF1064